MPSKPVTNAASAAKARASTIIISNNASLSASAAPITARTPKPPRRHRLNVKPSDPRLRSARLLLNPGLPRPSLDRLCDNLLRRRAPNHRRRDGKPLREERHSPGLVS